MKSIKILAAIILTVLISGCSQTEPVQLINLGAAKKAVQSYYESGEYDRECSKIIDEAINYLDKENITEKSVVIFDVDETSLSNYQYTKKIGFGFIPKSWDEEQLKGDAPAIKSTKRFYDYLVSRNIRVVFLTGRDEDALESTRRNLIEQGYAKFDTLIVRSENEKKLSAEKFKPVKRKDLIDKGYEIIASLGDQESDFAGENTGYKIKLPNYLYLID
ncbi:MAG: hypothetical protein CVV24_09230 [Ignavibacteriae bacterium HGW-Ignavibacteriae-3]|nr:MAG: hypothetical protein CVV24_09230 [Ignavibacteriae bacterium HGW-Ignavibacteriae-3]